MIKKLLINFAALPLFLGCLFCFSGALGQTNTTEDFERSSATLLSTSVPVDWTSNQANTTSGFITASGPFNGQSLTFNNPTSGTSTPLMYGRIAGTSFSIGSNVWEWTFLYQAPASVTPSDNAAAGVSGNNWRFWVNASGNDPSVSGFKGYYVTQNGSALKFYYYCNGCGGRSEVASFNITAGAKYVIRIVHASSGGGEWQFYATTYVDASSFPTSMIDKVFDQLGGNSSTYNYSFFQASVSSSGNNGIFKWDNVSMYQASISVSGLNSVSNGITTTVNPGETQRAFFGFKITTTGQYDINNININFPAGSNATYFSNAKLYSSTDDVFSSINDSPISTGALNNTNVAFSGLTETIVNSSKSYFLVADVNTFNNSSSPSTVYFRFASGQSQDALIRTSPYTTFNTYNIDGSTLTMPPNSTFIWTGSSNNTNFNDNSNWANFGFPTTTSNVTIPGGRSYYPVITANTSIGSITFSGLTPKITINSGFTLTPSGNITVEANSTPSILGPGAVNSSANIITNTGSVLTLTAPVTLTSTGAITNAGTIGISTTALTVAGASTNSGTINQTGTGASTFSTTLNNTGTFNNTSSGTTTFTGTLTNSSTGNILTSNGTLNVTAAFTNSGTFSPSGGIVNFANTFTNSGTSSVSGGTLNFANNFTNSSGSTFTATAGTVDFNLTTGNQTITNSNTTTPVIFYNLNISNSSGTTRTKTLSTSNFAIASSGKLTLSGSSVLAAAGLLTLRSDASSTASVAAIPSGASVTGNVTVQRYFTGGSLSNRGWRLMSSPVNNTGIVPATSLATYNFTSLKTNLIITGTGGSATGWDQPSGYTANGPTILFYSNIGSGSFTVPAVFATTTGRVGQGFYFYFRGDNSNPLSKVVRSAGNFATPEANVVGFQTGTLNQGNFSYTLSNTGTGYNLVGNPYPSSISVTSGALTGTTGFVYTFTPGGNSITSNSTPITIGSGQGFFVKSNNVTSSIAFSESMKTASQPLTLLMGTPVTDPGEGSVKLQMVQDSANYDIAQLRFSDNYTSNYVDTEDADDLNGSGQTVFFGALTADKHLVGIASQPFDKKKTSVFLSVDDNSSGIFSIKKVDLFNIPDKYDVWLMDHFKKDSLDLRANNTYNFSIDKSNPLTFGDNRLEVVIRVKDLPKYQLTSFTGKRSQGANTLQWNAQNEYTFTYFELERSFDNKTFEGVNNSMSTASGSYTFTDRGVANSLIFYRLKQTDIYGNTYTSNIIILPEDVGDKVFSVYPNPVSNFLKFDIKAEVKGNVTMSIYNSVGRMVKSSSHSSTTGQENVSSLSPGSYTVELIDNGTKKRLASTKFIKQ